MQCLLTSQNDIRRDVCGAAEADFRTKIYTLNGMTFTCFIIPLPCRNFGGKKPIPLAKINSMNCIFATSNPLKWRTIDIFK